MDAKLMGNGFSDGRIYAGHFNDDQAHPALGPLDIIIQQPIRHRTIPVGIISSHRGHYNSVSKLHHPNLNGLEQLQSIRHIKSPQRKEPLYI
jgi:hypothetical protein